VKLPTNAGDAGTVMFGRFRLISWRQLLLRDGVVVPIGSRALEILIALVQHNGELVTKKDLMSTVWPDTFVDESNLKVNVCLLRRSLGDTRKHPQYIATVPGRGYRFVAPVQREIAVPVSASASPPDICAHPREIAEILAAFRHRPDAIAAGRAIGMGLSLVRPLT
jgi:DNA-binding winged helix-turn-helix (wHTH) protein